MRKLLAIFALCLIASPAFASFGSASTWDVRTTGVDTNGGAFDSGVGSPGTDESQGSGTAITVTLTGTTTGTGSPAFSSTTHGPGNFVHIASGTGCTTGWYEILSQSAGTATFDHAMGSSTNVCTGTIGGSLLTVGTAAGLALDRNTIYVQNGTYTITSSVTETTDIWLNGYNSTHGDNPTGTNRPLLTTATNSTQILLVSGSRSNGATRISNFRFSNTAATRAPGIESRSGSVVLYIDNSLLTGFTKGVNCDNNGSAFSCTHLSIRNSEITAFTTYAFELNGGQGEFVDDYIHDAALTSSPPGCGNNAAVCLPGGPSVVYNRVVTYNITGTSADCIQTAAGTYFQAYNSVFDGCAEDGVNLSSSSFYDQENNVYYNNGRYGLNAGGTPYQLWQNNLAYGANGTSAVSPGITTGNNPVTLSAQPFTNPASGDFSPNSTAGGGASLKGAGFPGIAPFGTGYGSIGSLEVQSTSGGSGSGAYAYTN